MINKLSQLLSQFSADVAAANAATNGAAAKPHEAILNLIAAVQNPGGLGNGNIQTGTYQVYGDSVSTITFNVSGTPENFLLVRASDIAQSSEAETVLVASIAGAERDVICYGGYGVKNCEFVHKNLYVNIYPGAVQVDFNPAILPGSELIWVADGVPGGTELPTLSNPASAMDITRGKQSLDQYGNIIFGTSDADVNLQTATEDINRTRLAVASALNTSAASYPSAEAAAIAAIAKIGTGSEVTLFGRKFSSGSFSVSEDNQEWTQNFDSSIGTPVAIICLAMPIEDGLKTSRIGFVWYSSALMNIVYYSRTINITVTPAGVIGSNTGTSGVIRDSNVYSDHFVVRPNSTYPLKAGLTYHYIVLGDEAV